MSRVRVFGSLVAVLAVLLCVAAPARADTHEVRVVLHVADMHGSLETALRNLSGSSGGVPSGSAIVDHIATREIERLNRHFSGETALSHWGEIHYQSNVADTAPRFRLVGTEVLGGSPWFSAAPDDEPTALQPWIVDGLDVHHAALHLQQCQSAS